MDVELEKLKSTADMFGEIDMQLAALESNAEISQNDIKTVKQAITSHEKNIHNRLNSFRKAVKSSHRDDDVVNFSPLPDSTLATLDTLIYEHLCIVGLGDVAELMDPINKNLEEEFQSKSFSFDKKQMENIAFEINQVKEWLKQGEEKVVYMLLTSPESPKIKKYSDYFLLSFHCKFFVTLMKDELGALDYLNWMYSIIRSSKGSEHHYLFQKFNSLVSLICQEIISNNSASSWSTIEELERNLDDLIVDSVFPQHKPIFFGNSPLAKLVEFGASAIAHHPRELRAFRWNPEDSLPVEVSTASLNPSHTVFVCPVTKEEIPSEAGIFLLPCKHLMSSDAVEMMRVASNLHCPYCKSRYSEGNIVPIELL